MTRTAALFLALAAMNEGRAATAYVTDELVLGVYAAQNTQGQRLATLHSGAAVETLVASGDSTQVRLADGTTGWVKTLYLTTREPATVQLKLLQDELDRSRATSPGLAEAAERIEVQRLKREVARQADLIANGTRSGERQVNAWIWVLCIAAALGCGFWLGYAALARRIKYKFGGIKVY